MRLLFHITREIIKFLFWHARVYTRIGSSKLDVAECGLWGLIYACGNCTNKVGINVNFRGILSYICGLNYTNMHPPLSLSVYQRDYSVLVLIILKN